MTKQIKRVSPSQIRLYLECPRKWYYQYVVGIKSPTTDAHRLGTRVHALLERWLLEGTAPNGEHAHLAQAVIDSGTITRGEHIIGVEKRTSPPIGFGDTGITLNGIVDVVERREDGGLRITDFKTTSSFKWLKTEEQLRSDVQAICYSRWASLAFSGLNPENNLTFRLIYVNKKTAQVREVRVDLTLAELHAGYGRLTEHVADMRDLALQDITQARPDRSACSNYGGCHVLGTCKHVPFGDTNTGPFSGRITGEDTMAKKTLAELLAAKKARLSAPAEATPPAVAPKPAAPPAPTAASVKPEFTPEFTPEGATATAQVVENDVLIVAPDAPADQGPVPFEQRRFDQLGLGNRTRNVLRKVNIETPGDLLAWIRSGKSLTDINGCGKSSVQEIEALMGDRLVAARTSEEAMQAHTVEGDGAGEALPPVTKPPVERVAEPVKPRVTSVPGAIVLLIDCYPTKAEGFIGMGHGTPLIDVLRELMLTKGAEEHEYYNAAPYAEGPRKLAAMVLQNLDRFRGRTLLVNSSLPSTPYVLEVLEPAAGLVIRGGR